MHQRFLPPLFIFVLCVLTGCSEGHRMAPASTPEAAPEAAPAPQGKPRFLALEHAIRIETDEDKVAPLLRAAQDACAKAATSECAVLDSSIRNAGSTHASLKLRARPDGIAAIRQVLAGQGKQLEESTTAQDLAEPIADTAKRVAILASYREQLLALAAKPGLDADALIKVHHELAQVQGQLESQAGEQAQLTRRVHTEILRVEIGSAGERDFLRPITRALGDFGGQLAQGIAGTVSAVAYLLPGALVLWLLVWMVLALRARVRRRAQRNAKAA